MNTNFLPVINDMTLFFNDRIIIIPFDRHFDEHSRGTVLKYRFAKEGIQSAILNWLLEGYRLLQTEVLFLPQSVKTTTDRYQHDSDKMALFFENNLVVDDTAEELTSAVYARYKGSMLRWSVSMCSRRRRCRVPERKSRPPYGTSSDQSNCPKNRKNRHS